jgi:protein-disulfide isomerase
MSRRKRTSTGQPVNGQAKAAAEGSTRGPTKGPTKGGQRPSAREQARDKIARENKRRREQRIIFVVAAAVVLALIGGGIGIQLWRSRKAPDTPNQSAASAVAQLNAVVPPVTGKPLVLGQADAPVTVTLYEDFHCPHCAEFEERYGSILTDAQIAGRIKIELYPMAFIDAGSARASNAMACAAEAGFPQTYYLGLFANPSLDWNASQLISLATTVGGAATPEFTRCVDDGKHDAWVTSINAAANANGVSSTPTMFIDAQPVDITTLTTDSLRNQLDEAARS